jgi:hypothetical protein
LADSARMSQLGYMKYGRTQRTVGQRVKEHQGQYECDPGEIIFELEVADCVAAEALAKALFRSIGMHLPGRKELITRDVAKAIEVLKQAQALHVPTTAFAPVVNKHAGSQVATDHAAWSALLALPLAIMQETKTLGAWLAESLVSTRLRKRLEALQVWCVNADSHAPEFELKYLSNEWAGWLATRGHTPHELVSDDGDLYFQGRLAI